jgi:hypothetical protein
MQHTEYSTVHTWKEQQQHAVAETTRTTTTIVIIFIIITVIVIINLTRTTASFLTICDQFSAFEF